MPDSMEAVAVHAPRHVPTLLDLADDAVAAASGPSVGDDDNQAVTLGPSVGDDNGRTANLGPCVGDDQPGASLGPSVGDDEGPVSDRRRKIGIRRVGSAVFGLPLYDFRYIGGREVYRGVMAQDVLAVMPDAVVNDWDGYLRVRYGMLGIGMQRVA